VAADTAEGSMPENRRPAIADRPPPPEALESLPVDAVFAAVGSGRDGLAAAEAAARLGTDGPNVIIRTAAVSTARKLAANFTHVMALLLWVGGGVAFGAGLPELGIAIWAVNLINGVFSFWQEHKAERAVEALQGLLPVRVTVLRDGVPVEVPAAELVRGDLMVLEEGQRISADGRVVDHVELRVDQSALTGESNPVRKAADPVPVFAGNRAEIPDLVFAGTTVVSGRGRAVVVATGMATEIGRIAGLTEQLGTELSPLQKELARVSRVVSTVAVGVGAAFFVMSFALAGMDLSRGFVFSLGMIAAFIPEGLLPTVTLSLAIGTQRMARRNALVRRLSAVETLGSTSVICTDKTGTLTANEMTVREVFVPGGRFAVSGTGYEPGGEATLVAGEEAARADLRHALAAAATASNARLVAEDGRRRIVGDPTEGAILVAAEKLGVAAVRPARRGELPFDSRRKRMAVLTETDDGWVLACKGAPSEILPRCTGRVRGGVAGPFAGAEREEAAAANDAMSGSGLRVLAVAERRFPSRPLLDESLEDDLTFLGLVGMVDPPRPEVAAAVATCRRAGIRIVMMTGDYGLTALAVARVIGLVGDGDVRIVNGDEVGAMSPAELDATLAAEVLFARVSPEHKLAVVSALQRQGHVVAVTGDGVNDAPALKQADIGVAMGRSGTDVAREAADMVLLDDNFASIVAAVEGGRAVFANLKRFTSYIFTSNTPEAVPFIAFGFSGGRIPLALDVMPILSIDLGTDMVPALGLGAEPAESGIMDAPPRDPSEHLVTRALLTRAYLWLGPVQAAAVMAVFFAVFWVNGQPGRFLDLPAGGSLHRQATSMALAVVVATQIGNLFAHRARGAGWRSNRLVWIGIASEVAVVLLLVYAPPLQTVIGTAAVPAAYWLWLVPLIPLLWIVDRIRGAVTRRSP